MSKLWIALAAGVMVGLSATAAPTEPSASGPAGETAQPPREEGKWTRLADMPTGRHDLMVLAFGGKLYAIGGSDLETTYEQVEVYDPATGKWSAAAPMTDKKGCCAMAVLDGKVYLMGGKTVQTPQEKRDSGDRDRYRYTAGTAVFDLAANTWSQAPPISKPLVDIKAVAHDGKVYALIGARMEVYDPAAGAWSAGPAIPQPRLAPGMELVGDRIYVIGGDAEKGLH